MKNAPAAINLVINALFLTNLWIILYTKLNDYLYFRFPPHQIEIFFRQGLGNPEPFEIPLYILLTLTITALIWLYYRFVKKNVGHIPPILKYIVLLLLFVLFVSKLNSFPYAGDIAPYILRLDKISYFLGFLIYIGVIFLITLEFTFIKKFFANKKWINFLLFVLLFFIIAMITFEPHFAISIPDASLFYGPAYEIASGKTIFTQVPSQYGFLSILLFAFIYKITHLSFIYLPVIIWLMLIIEYFLCFYLILKTSKSIFFSLMGLFSILTVNFISATAGPQAGALRWLPLFLLLFLFYKFKKIDSKPLLFLVPILGMWNIDSGIALIFGYILTLFFLLVLLPKIKIKRFISALIFFIFFTALVAIIIQSIHLFLGLQAVDFSQLYSTINKNAILAILMVPIPDKTYFWLVILIYFASIIFFFKKMQENIPDLRDLGGPSRLNRDGREPTGVANRGIDLAILIFSANLMFFASIYYVGRSMPGELFTISIFVLVTFFLLTGIYLKEINSPLQRNVILVLIFIITICYPCYLRKEYIADKLLNKISRLSHGHIFSSQLDRKVQSFYKDEVLIFKKNIPESQILILSSDDTYLLYLFNKKNLLDVNPIWGTVGTKNEIDKSIQKISANCPKKILADCSIAGRCHQYKTLTSGDSGAFPLLLTAIEKKCQVKYTPTICTNKLCLTEKK